MADSSTVNQRTEYDAVLQKIADYVLQEHRFSPLAYETAYYALLDSLACASLAFNYPACTKLLGPVVPNTSVDPIKTAFDWGALIRWLDFNDTWLAAEWGHPSDNLGAILSLSDYCVRHKKQTITIKDILNNMIIAYEIQGIFALENSFNKVGLDHVILVKLASTAVALKVLGATREQMLVGLSQVFVDGQSLRTYRHAPNVGSRKSWAAGDATSRAVRLAFITLQNEKGYPSCLTAEKWGFYDVLFGGKPFKISREYGSYVMENILFKISYPAEFHSQTALEAAIQLHPHIRNKINTINKIVVSTHEAAIRIISKTGQLYNPADRDHCLQYIIAVGLLFGELDASHYEDNIAKDPRIDQLRKKMVIEENKSFSQDYLDPEKRSISNSIQIYFEDNISTEKVTVEYPIGHKRRRSEGIPLLLQKFKQAGLHQNIQDLCLSREKFEKTAVTELMDLLYNQFESVLGNRC
jgi:2-methylcitrate dehydratase